MGWPGVIRSNTTPPSVADRVHVLEPILIHFFPDGFNVESRPSVPDMEPANRRTRANNDDPTVRLIESVLQYPSPGSSQGPPDAALDRTESPPPVYTELMPVQPRSLTQGSTQQGAQQSTQAVRFDHPPSSPSAALQRTSSMVKMKDLVKIVITL